jgi:hypothetical protein
MHVHTLKLENLDFVEGGFHHKFELLNFLKSVIATWLMHEVVS